MTLLAYSITIVGAGGVGGLLGAQLIRKYGSMVSFIARGIRLHELRQVGLTIRSELYGNYTVYPNFVTSESTDLPVQDIVLVCVKNPDIAATAQQILPIVSENTTVITLANGITSGGVLRRALPAPHILSGVIYTVSALSQDGCIHQQGKFTRLIIGAEGGFKDTEKALIVAELFTSAGIECRVSETIQTDIWEKYVFNCAYNVATARWLCCAGDIKSSPERMRDFRSLLEEAFRVGTACGIELPDNTVEVGVNRLLHTGGTSSSSLMRDFSGGRPGELDSFSGELLRLAEKHHVPVPITATYDRALRANICNRK